MIQAASQERTVSLQETRDQGVMPAGVPLGLIAGGGQFPLFLCQKLQADQRPIYIVAHKGESDPVLADYAQAITWISVGQIGRMLKFFQQHAVREICFLGSIQKTGLLRKFRPDWTAMKILLTLPHQGDDRVLRGLLQFLERSGLSVRAAAELLPECVPQAGVLAGTHLRDQEEKDAQLAWQCLESLSEYDVGQTMVVHQGCIIAVEAVEGTDAAILRAGELTSPGCVVVKRSKRGQERRVDLPAIGPDTVHSLIHAKARALVLEAESCLMLHPEEVRRLAEAAGISIVVYPCAEKGES